MTRLLELAANRSDALPWVEFEIPGGSERVEVIRVGGDKATGATTLLVKFPAGWQRTVPGHYKVAEEFVVVRGELVVNDVATGAGGWSYLPSGFERSASRAQRETITLARFLGPPRWHAEPGDPHVSLRQARCDPVKAEPQLPLNNVAGQALHRQDGKSSYFVPLVPAGTVMASDIEALWFDEPAWAEIPAGSEVPDRLGPCFLRVSASEDLSEAPA